MIVKIYRDELIEKSLPDTNKYLLIFLLKNELREIQRKLMNLRLTYNLEQISRYNYKHIRNDLVTSRKSIIRAISQIEMFLKKK